MENSCDLSPAIMVDSQEIWADVSLARENTRAFGQRVSTADL